MNNKMPSLNTKSTFLNKSIFLYFQVEHDPKGANGDGMAVVSSLRSFDREQQKEYEVPIVIKDSGNPSMSGN